MKVKEESEKVGLKLNTQKMKIMASGPITSWQIDGETMETVRDFIFLGSKITADGDCSHEIKRHLLLGWRRQWHPTPVLLPGKSHRWRSLVSCSPWGRQESDTTSTSLSLFTFMHWRRKWQPTPVFLPGESQGQGSLAGCCLWGHTESDTTEATQQQLLGRKVMTNPDSTLKSRDITLPAKVHLVKAMVFPVVCMDVRIGL